MSSTLKPIHVAAAVSISVLLAGICVRYMPSKTASAATKAPATTVASAAPVNSANAATPATDDGYPGVLVAPAAVDLAATIEGRISDIKVSAGDQVSEGMIVAMLDDKAARNALAVAKAGLGAAAADASSARIEHALAKDRASRRVGTVNVGGEEVAIVSKEEQAQVGFAAKVAAARASAAGSGAAERAARVEQLKTLLAETQLKAPFTGVVAARYADPGTYVRPGMPIVRIISSSELKVRFAVPEEDARRIHAGQAYVASLDGRPIPAVVSAVAPEVEAASRMVFVDGTVQGVAAGEAAALAGRVVRVRVVK
jgi:RND family efflux transporter MFP subunit